MRVLNINSWYDQQKIWYHHQRIFKHIEENSPSIINFFAIEEPFSGLCARQALFFDINKLHDYCIKKDIRVNHFLSLNESSTLYHNPKDRIFLYTDPVFHFRRSFVEYKNLVCDTQHYQYKIICLMHRNHKHRQNLLNELLSRDLVKNNAISYHNSYVWKNKCYRKILLESEDSYFDCNKQWDIPLEWHKSFLHIVSETTDNIQFITEKTCAPLLGGKLFIVQAARNFHQKLKELGFELYDEIIDYNFDSIEDPRDRLTAMMSQVEKVIKLSNYSQVYKDINLKLKYNQDHAIKLATTPVSTLPTFAVNYYKKFYSFY